MRCHYDILNIARSASDDELKKAYRKLALKWHPDKNPDNIEEAKREFILIQQAFEVLSDPQERAFYDRHRDSILKGAGSGYKDEALDIFSYFSSSCYSGYDSSENGFYTVYREVFNKLAAEESEYWTDDVSPPEFGNEESSYDVVKDFYGHWLSFSTKKTYSWTDTYDLREAENRQIARLMQQENKKVREKAKKERNDQVRALVQFVRKRDKRVQAYADYLKMKTEENNRKTEEHRRKMIAKNRKEIESCKESEWSKFSNFENQLKEIENIVASEFDDHDDESDESAIDELFCVACNKSFKTEKAFANHEKSKKHRDNVILLKNTMNAEESIVNCDNSSESEEDLVVDSFCEACNKNFKTEKAFDNHKQSQKHHENTLVKSLLVSDEDDVDYQSEDDLTSKLLNLVLTRSNSDESNGEKVENDDLVQEGSSKSVKKSKNSKKKKKKAASPIPFADDKEEIDLSEIGSSKKQKKRMEREKILSTTEKKLSPRTIRRIKKMLEVPKPPPPEPKYMKDLIDFTGLEHRCAYCNQSFVSNNKLFKHLNTSGHAVYLPKEELPVKPSKSSRNRK